jgi:hypothetical protein
MLPPNRKPRSKFTPAANSFLRSTGRIANKGFNAVAKQNAGVANYWVSRSSLVSSMQKLNLNLASVRRSSRSIRRIKKQHAHYVAHGEYPAIPLQVWEWCRDEVLLRLLDVLWAHIQPILFSIFYALLMMVLIIVVNVLFFGAIYLLLTA